MYTLPECIIPTNSKQYSLGKKIIAIMLQPNNWFTGWIYEYISISSVTWGGSLSKAAVKGKIYSIKQILLLWQYSFLQLCL